MLERQRWRTERIYLARQIFSVSLLIESRKRDIQHVIPGLITNSWILGRNFHDGEPKTVVVDRRSKVGGGVIHYVIPGLIRNSGEPRCQDTFARWRKASWGATPHFTFHAGEYQPYFLVRVDRGSRVNHELVDPGVGRHFHDGESKATWRAIFLHSTFSIDIFSLHVCDVVDRRSKEVYLTRCQVRKEILRS